MKNRATAPSYVPLSLFLVYLMISLCLALFGPINFIDFPKDIVVFYMSYIVVCCLLGYHFGVRSCRYLNYRTATIGAGRNQLPPKALTYTLLISGAGLGAYFVALVLSGGLNTNIMALGQAYADVYEGYQRNSGSYSASFLVYSALAAPVYIASVWGLFYFFDINRMTKLFVIAVLILNIVIFTLGSGKMKQVGDIVIYLIAISLIGRTRKQKTFSAKLWISVTTIAIFGVIIFAFIASQRYSLMGVDLFNVNLKTSWRIKYDVDHPIFKIFGPRMGFALALVSAYISQGYYGLGLALESSFTWSHFLGSSYSMSVLAQRFLHIPPGYYVSYPYLTGVETGWGESHWYTVFPWFASDVTFAGTGILFAFFAFWYARTWLESVVLGDPYSILLFTLITVGAFYVPANNQLMQTPAGLSTLLLVVVLYAATAKRRRLVLITSSNPHVFPAATDRAATT